MKKTDFQFSVFVGKVSQRLLPTPVLKECVSYFRVESSGTLGRSGIFGSAHEPAKKGYDFPCSSILHAYKESLNGGGESFLWLTVNFLE